MTAARLRRGLIGGAGALASTLAAALLLTACTPPGQSAEWTESSPQGAVAEALPVERLTDAEPTRVADGVAAPTSTWYAGLAFGDAPQPVYPYPLAFAMQGGGFAIDLPAVTAGERTITAGFAGGLAVDLGARSFEIVRGDPVSVTLRLSDADGVLGDLTIAEGSPIVAFTAARDVALLPAATLEAEGKGLWSTTADATAFGVKAPGATWSGGALNVSDGDSAQWFAVPDGGELSDWADAIAEPVTGVDVSYRSAGDEASTRLTYTGTSATVVVPFAGRDGADSCDLGTFTTAYGPADACASTTLEWSVASLQPRDQYDFEELDDETRATLAAQIEADLAATGPLPADTYYGGKALARLAALLSLARSLDETAIADAVADRLDEELAPWANAAACEDEEAHCFVYDDVLQIVVGKTPSFGSEEGNDHHFHYGYFLAAAAALVEARPDQADRLAPVMDALAADIAAGAPDGTLAPLRVFDPYRGHSWASGLSPFADGNNQESTSEAVAAWNGLALWAKVRGDDQLAATATWLLSAEADAARALWLEPAPESLPDGYERGIVSLTWSAKRDYATWFSAEPSAILGIQILPVGPISLDYLTTDPDRVAANVAEAGDAAFTGALGDYVLLYSALAGPDARTEAESAAAELAPAELDDGTSMSAVLAWLEAVRLAQEE